MDVERLFLLWNADAGAIARLAYVAKKLVGNGDCALCEATHDVLGEKKRWKACKRAIAIPFEGVYRDRASDEQRRAAEDEFPCVLAQTPGGLVKLLGRETIEACGGDVDVFAERLRDAIGLLAAG